MTICYVIIFYMYYLNYIRYVNACALVCMCVKILYVYKYPTHEISPQSRWDYFPISPRTMSRVL